MKLVSKLFLVTMVVGLSAQAGEKKLLQIEKNKKHTDSVYEIIPTEAERNGRMFADGGFIDIVDKVNLNAEPVGQAIDHVGVILDKIINIGEKVYNIVEKGRGVIKFNDYVERASSAVPQGITKWQEVERLRAARGRFFHIEHRFLGVKVLQFDFRVEMLYGGKVNGVGNYIGYATIIPTNLYAAWGWNITAQAQVQKVYNIGTVQDPIAGMVISVKYHYNSAVAQAKELQFFLNGQTGEIKLAGEN